MKIYKVYDCLFNTNDVFKIWKHLYRPNQCSNVTEEEIKKNLVCIDVDTTQPFFHQLVQVGASVKAEACGIVIELSCHCWIFNQEHNELPDPMLRTIKFDEHLNLPVIKL